jgi:phosphoglycolate phosphatase
MLTSLIWDWNGTLLDDVDICVAAMNDLLGRRGLAGITRSTHRERFTFPVKRYYESLGFSFATESFSLVADEYHDAYGLRAAQTRLHPDAVDGLQMLRRRGVRQLLLSALEEGPLIAQLKQHGIIDYFSAVYGLSDGHARGKLARARDLMATESESGGRPGTWMVADTVHDAEVAHTVGVRCALVSTGHQSEEQLRQTSSPVFDSIGDALSFMIADKDEAC